jgi:capsular exopolysaccharide synthesis family protein
MLFGLGGMVVAMLLPEQYKAVAIIEVADGNQMRVFDGADAGGGNWRGTSTQLSIMTSGEVLRRAVDILQSEGMGGADTTPENLGRRTLVRMIPNTPLLQVTVKDSTPELAAAAANAVVNAYSDVLSTSEEVRGAAEMSALRLEVERQRGAVERSERSMRAMADAGGVLDLNPDSEATVREASDDAIVVLEREAMRAKTEADETGAIAERLGEMNDGEFFDGEATMGFAGGATSWVAGSIRETEAEISRVMGTGLGPLHPTVRALQAKLLSHQEHARELTGAIRKALDSRVRAGEEMARVIEGKLAQEKLNLDARRAVRGRYEEAKADFLQSNRILQEAEERLLTGAIQTAMPRDILRVWEKAEAAGAWSTSNVALAWLVCTAVGLALGVALAFFMDYLDTSARTVRDVEAVLDTSMLCVVPAGTRSLARAGWRDQDAEPYQMLRLAVEGAEGFRRGFVLAVTSGAAGEGKSTTTANLACAFAAGGYRVLIVDCDLRRPSQHRIFGVRNEGGGGISGILRGSEAQELDTCVRGVRIVRAGDAVADPEAVLSSPTMGEFLKNAKDCHDIVILDSPPILGLGDAGILARAADHTLVVVRHRMFPASMLAKAKVCLEAAGARVAGAVLNDTDIRHDENFDRYTGYYGYYRPQADINPCY